MTSISRAGSRYTLLPKDITIYDINVITGSQVKAEYVICFSSQRTTLNHATIIQIHMYNSHGSNFNALANPRCRHMNMKDKKWTHVYLCGEVIRLLPDWNTVRNTASDQSVLYLYCWLVQHNHVFKQSI